MKNKKEKQIQCDGENKNGVVKRKIKKQKNKKENRENVMKALEMVSSREK